MASKVKTPSVYYNQQTLRSREEFRDSIARFRSRWRDSYTGEYSPYRAAGFGTYDLALHGLNYPQSYGSREVLDRIIRQRAGEPYLIGVELEIENADRRSDISETLKRYLPDRHICVSDGSLRGEALEIVTSPLAPTEIGRVQWYSLLRELDRLRCTSHKSGRCGLHVSISRSYLKESTWEGLRAFLTRKSLFFKEISRRERGEGTGERDPFYFCRFSNVSTKYTALNLSKSAVAEFRFFRGTLKVESFLASLEIVRSLVEWAKGLEASGRVRFDSRSWVATLDRFPVAKKYVGDRVSLLTARRERSGVPRVRLTDWERRERALRRLVNSRCWSLDLSIGSGLTLSASCSYRLPIAWGVGVTTTEELNQREYPIDWSRSRVPEYLRDVIRRGLFPNSLWINSRSHTIEPCCAVFRHIRGGWGNGSRFEIEIVPVVASV